MSKRILLASDSFKGTLSAVDICDVMKEALLARFPDSEVILLPVADGGEGSVECLLAALGGKRVNVRVSGPYGRPMDAVYGVLPDGTAVVETASCAGLPLVGDDRRPDRTTTYGVGELLCHAADSGCRRILLGLGGSCTNDGGAGAAAACGVRFLDRHGDAFVPVGGTLRDIASVDRSAMCPALRETELIALCDVDNPLCGPSGAAAVFAPQKGADPAMADRLDDGLRHWAQVVAHCVGKDVLSLPGAGAAGGLGGGATALLGAALRRGIDTVLDQVDFDRQLAGADLVFTGEGRLDSQSLRGKVVVGVARRAQSAGVPVVAVVGDAADDAGDAYAEGVTAVFSINRLAVPFEKARPRSRDDLRRTMDDIARLLTVAGWA